MTEVFDPGHVTTRAHYEALLAEIKAEKEKAGLQTGSVQQLLKKTHGEYNTASSRCNRTTDASSASDPQDAEMAPHRQGRDRK